jgi:hypothetical protein
MQAKVKLENFKPVSLTAVLHEIESTFKLISKIGFEFKETNSKTSPMLRFVKSFAI